MCDEIILTMLCFMDVNGQQFDFCHLILKKMNKLKINVFTHLCLQFFFMNAQYVASVFSFFFF